MAPTRLGGVVRRLGRGSGNPHVAALPDADLWERYTRDRDETAFEALVHRHGPMVLGVCRRVLRNEQDTEDAFQATFLVLVRRAPSLQSPGTIANWLYGVAYRTALEARSAAIRRRVREAALVPRTVSPDDQWAELRAVLDEELCRLAEKYRAVIVLSDLEGKTRRDVACQLGLAEGTVASRLARGRGILAERLARRGFTGALVAMALAGGIAEAHLPSELATSTAQSLCLSAAETLFSERVIAITQGVLKSMLLAKIRSGVAVLLALGVTVLGAGGLISSTSATEPRGGKGRVKPDDVPGRVEELKRQMVLMQIEIAKLESETRAGRARPDSAAAALADRFKYRITFETGFTESKGGGRIEIREVWGTRPKIEVGGQYLVRGKYTLPQGQRGKIYFYETSDTAPLVSDLDLQSAVMDKAEGEFTLVHGMTAPGYFHLYLADPDRYSQMFANVYFGTGDNVWRPKP